MGRWGPRGRARDAQPYIAAEDHTTRGRQDAQRRRMSGMVSALWTAHALTPGILATAGDASWDCVTARGNGRLRAHAERETRGWAGAAWRRMLACATQPAQRMHGHHGTQEQLVQQQVQQQHLQQEQWQQQWKPQQP